MSAYEKLQKQKEKLSQEKQKIKQKSKPKPNPKPKQKIKTFDEYFQECIKNKTIPKDTPPYLKKALELAMKEYDKEIKHEKSALQKFAEKYVIDGKPGLTPPQFFAEKVPRIKDFLRNHRNIKVRMIFLFSKDHNQHFSLIKNFSRLTRSQITSDKRKLHICKKCLSHFTKIDLFEKHLFYCSQNETVAVKMPTKNT